MIPIPASTRVRTTTPDGPALALIAACTGILLLSIACAPEEPSGPVIGASIPPLASLTREITGDRIAAMSLLPPGTSPHDYDPTPADLARIRMARAFVVVGTPVDGWMEGAVRGAMESESPIVAMSEVAPEGADPHLWLDLEIVRSFVPRLVQALARVDPEGASGYQERAGVLLARLDRFDEEAERELAPCRGSAFALHHPAFVRFVERYRLNLVAVLQEHPEGEAEPRTLGEVTRKMQTAGAGVLFAEPQLGSRLARSVATDLGARVASLDALGGEGWEGRETYLDLLEWNLRQLVENLDDGGD